METRIITLSTNRSYYDVKQAAEDSITVEELMEELRYLPGDCKVVFKNDNGYTYGYISARDVDSEYPEPEEEKNDPAIDRADMEYNISEAVRKNDDKPVKLGAVWGDKRMGREDVEFTALGFNDSRVLGVATDGEDFIPIDELTSDEVEDIWNTIYFRQYNYGSDSL
jgi:hypothetical protein